MKKKRRERFFVGFDHPDTGHFTLIECNPGTSFASGKYYIAYHMPEDQTEIKIMGNNSE